MTMQHSVVILLCLFLVNCVYIAQTNSNEGGSRSILPVLETVMALANENKINEGLHLLREVLETHPNDGEANQLYGEMLVLTLS